MDLTRDGREAVFIWVPGHVGIRGNPAADSAAKVALDATSRMSSSLSETWSLL